MPQLGLLPYSSDNSLSLENELVVKSRSGVVANRLATEDRAVHDWYRFVLSYPPHLVREYLDRLGIQKGMTVLDPFCGTGTTCVECKKLSISSIGIEANAMAHFAAATKVDWNVSSDLLFRTAEQIASQSSSLLSGDGHEMVLREVPAEAHKILLSDSISALPLHKTLTLLEVIESSGHKELEQFFKLALAKALVGPIGNLRFGPEVGITAPKMDAPVVDAWLQNVRSMAGDLEQLSGLEGALSVVHYADARDLSTVVEPSSIDAVITSPPYPNEKDYTRTTRLESVILGFLNSKEELRSLKKGLLRSNTRNVYKGDEDHQWISHHPEIQRIATEIEERRIELGKTSGFEKLYSTVTKLYFGGMARHLSSLKMALRPGAHLAYVVGDQASYLRVMIRTGQLLAQIAEDLGYEVVSIDLFRTRLATTTQEQLREEVVVLRWPGEKR